MDVNLYNLYTEGKLVKEQREKLKDSDFGLPNSREYPIHDEEHTKKAIQLFSHCKEENKNELANNIFKKASKYNIKISEKSNLYKYLSDKNKKANSKIILSESLDDNYIGDSIDFLKIKLNTKNIDDYCFSLPKLLTIDFDEENEDGIILVDRYDQAAGYIYYNKTEHRLIDIYVSPIYRQQGYATQLLLRIKWDLFSVRVPKDNEVAKQFFDHNNFKIIGESKFFYLMTNDPDRFLNENGSHNFSGITDIKLNNIGSYNNGELSELSVAGIADVSGGIIGRSNKFITDSDLIKQDLFTDDELDNDKYLKSKYITNEDSKDEVSNKRILGIDRFKPDSKGIKNIELNVIDGGIDELKLNQVLQYINGNTFVTSDLHLTYKERSSNNLFNTLLNNFNSVMNIDDTLIICGDLGRKDCIETTYIDYLSNFINKLNVGRKILILGNHDNLKIKQYYDMGFNFVGHRLQTEKFIFTHNPVNIPENMFNIHGHIHGSREYWNVDWRRHIDVYIKDHEYKALTINEYMNLYKKGKYKGKTIKKDFTKEEV